MANACIACAQIRKGKCHEKCCTHVSHASACETVKLQKYREKNVESQQSVNFGNERCHASTCILYSVHLIRMSTLSRGNQYTVYSYFGNGRCVAATCIQVLQKRILSHGNPYTHFGNEYCLKATYDFGNKFCLKATYVYFGNEHCLTATCILTSETNIVSRQPAYF